MRTASALLLTGVLAAPVFACLDLHRTDCASNDPVCSGDVGWILYQQLIDPDIPLFQAVGAQALVLSSRDGNAWVRSASENSLSTGAFFGGVATDRSGNWVATGATGLVAISKDASDWRLATGTGGTPVILRGVSYSSTLKRWLSPATTTVVRYSPDGDAWFDAASPTGPNPFYSSAYGNGQFVAVGNSGGIYRSVAGEFWASAASNGTPTGILWSVTYAADRSQWMLVGVTGQIYFSSDGDTWTAAASSGVVTTNDLRTVRYGNGQYVAAGDGGTIIRSTDGNTWSLATSHLAFGAVTFAAMDYSPELNVWVAVGNGGLIIRSEDGDTWALAADSGLTTQSLFGVAAGLIPVANP